MAFAQVTFELNILCFIVIFGVTEGRSRFYGNSKFGTCQAMELALILALIKCEIATGRALFVIIQN